MQRFCLTLDLRPEPSLAAEYIRLHQQVWSEVQESIRGAGVLDMQIYSIATLGTVVEQKQVVCRSMVDSSRG